MTRAPIQPTTSLRVRALLRSELVHVCDVQCDGSCRADAGEEGVDRAELVLPYAGVFEQQVARVTLTADPVQIVVFRTGESYRVRHPAPGGDRCLAISPAPAVMDELSHRSWTRTHRRVPIAPGDQLVAHRLRRALVKELDMLAAEEAVVDVARRLLTTAPPRAMRRHTPATARLVDRARALLASDPARRRSLAEIGRLVGTSPVYLTQLFRAVEGVPLYRYQTRLRLAASLELLTDCDDVLAVALELGFASHSHFTAVFHRQFGLTPSAYRRHANGGGRRRLLKDVIATGRARLV